MTIPSTAPTTVISNPLLHHERTVISVLAAPIGVALPEVRGILSQGRLEPAIASELHTEWVSFLEAFLPELRDCPPHPRD